MFTHPSLLLFNKNIWPKYLNKNSPAVWWWTDEVQGTELGEQATGKRIINVLMAKIETKMSEMMKIAQELIVQLVLEILKKYN